MKKIVFFGLVSIILIPFTLAHGTTEEHTLENSSLDSCVDTGIVTKSYLPDPHKDLRWLIFGGSIVSLLLSISLFKLSNNASKKRSGKSSKKESDSFNINFKLIFAIIFLILFLALPSYHFWRYGLSKESIIYGPPGSIHSHADFKIYVDGNEIDFGKENYMTNKDFVVNKYTHLHDDKGNLIHVHATGITFGYFLNSIDFDLTKECFKFDTGQKVCNEETNKDGSTNKKWKFYVNGKINNEFNKYVIQDTDRILLTYGSFESEEGKHRIIEQYESITKEACIYSEKCDAPEGFVVTPENCG